MNRMVSFYVLLGIIGVIALLFLRVMASFLLPLFLAAVLVVIFTPMHRRIEAKFKKRRRLAAAATTTAIALIVIAPLMLILVFAGIEATSMVRNVDLGDAQPVLKRLRTKFGYNEKHMVSLRKFEINVHRLAKSAEDPNYELSIPATFALMEEAAEDFRPAVPDSVDKGLWQPVADELNGFYHTDFSIPTGMASRVIVEVTSSEQVRDLQQAFAPYKVHRMGGKVTSAIVTFLSPSTEEIQEMVDRMMDSGVEQKLLSLGASTLSLMARIGFGVAIMLISVYFFLVDGPAMVETMMRLSPLNNDYEHELVAEFSNISRAVVLATLLSAVAQGILAGVGYWFAGLGSVFLLTLLTTLFSLVPFIGAAAIWVPAALYLLLLTDATLAAILLSIYCVVFVSNVDNVVKPLVLKNQSQLHPLLALLSVIGGVQALGPIGILVGPMVVAFLQTLLNILHQELTEMEEAATATVEPD